jgi:hypothetical protein
MGIVPGSDILLLEEAHVCMAVEVGGKKTAPLAFTKSFV